MIKKGILLVNLGTPNSTRVSDVRRYLREFLMDKRVIDIPLIPRWLLVNLIIAPFRSPKSALEYKKLFTDRGSPLKFNTSDMAILLQEKLGKSFQVEFAMRYQNPSIVEALDRLRNENVSEIKVIPLFPQYASATTGSVIEKVMSITKDWQVIPGIEFVRKFFDHPLFLETIADQANGLITKNKYDHFVFSYHGLPERQIYKGDQNNKCTLGDCCYKLCEENRYCYRAQCFATSRLIAERLDIQSDQYTVCFQSRLGKAEWIKPYTSEILKELALNGKTKVLAFSPAFVSDCLETTIEVGETYRQDFINAGGLQWDLVPSLNTEDKWVECMVDLVKS